LSTDLEWVPSSGKGQVYSYSVVWRPPSPKFQVPYVVAIVALDEGFMMLANIIGCNHESVSVSLPVVAEFHPVGNEMCLPYFAPSGLSSCVV
jgi:hypothetical protein